MADKDVRLIIRAKNEASKEIKSISQAMRDLASETDDASKATKKNASIFGQLSAEIKKFNAQTQAFTAISKVQGIMDKAGEAADRLRSNVGGLKTELDKSRAATNAAAQNTATLRSNLEALQKTYEDQRAKTDAARKAQDRNSESTKNLSAAKKELARANELSLKNADREARIETAKSNISSAQATRDANVASYQQLNAALKNMRAEIQSADQAVSESEKQFRNQNETVIRLEAALSSATGELQKVEASLSEMSAEARDASQALGSVAGAEQEALAATKGLASQIERMGVALGALQRYSTGGKGFTDPKTAAAMREQREEMDRTRVSQQELQSIAAGLAAQMKATGDPTGRLAEQLKEVTGAAKAAKNEFTQQQTALAKLQGSAQSTFAEFSKANGSLPSLTANFERNRASADALAAAMQRYSTGAGGITNSGLAEKLRAQSAVVDQAAVRYLTLNAEVRRLQSIMNSGGGSSAQADQLRQVAQAANQAEKELKEANIALRQMKSNAGNPFASINSGGRESLSLFQRLRGEVLSLTASFVGFFGAIQGIGGVLTSFQQVEAANNRLGAVFKQNSTLVGNEIDWIRRQAGRLGIEFGELAGEYGKYAIAAQAANVSSEATRQSFIGIAEAGRVNKLSMEDMNGIFLALTQSLSKGKFQAEEVRGQLGERLPGAFTILAAALGKTTTELDKMMEKGEVLANEENLLKFAAELNKRFGSQLQASLLSTTTLLGQFANNTTQAQLQFANGGFIESFNAALQDLDKWFKSREGRDFFLSLGAAAGNFIDVLRVIPENLNTVLNIVKVLISVKLAQWFASLAGSMILAVQNARLWAAANTTLTTQTFSLNASMQALRATGASLGATFAGLTASTIASARGLTLAGSAAATARSIMSGATVAARALWVALGGWIGVIATGVALLATTLLGDWLGGVDEATSALDEHQRIMDNVLTKYDQVKGKTKDWADILKDMTLDELVANARNLSAEFDKVRSTIRDTTSGSISMFLNGWAGVYDQTVAIRQQFLDGKISATQLREAIEQIYSNTSNDEARKFLEGLLKSTREAERLSKAVGEATDAVNKKKNANKDLTTTLDGTKSALESAGDAAKENAAAFTSATDAADKYKAALDGIKGFIPSLAAELKKLKDQAKLDEFVNQLGFGPRTPEQQSLIDQAQQQINVDAIDLSPLQNTIDLTNAEFQKYYQTIKGRANLMSGSGGKYGDPSSKSWQSTNLTPIESASGRKTLVNKASAAAFQGFLNELEAQGYNVKSLGGYNYRKKVGGKGLSEHAYGNAIDINPTANPFSKTLQTDMPKMISQMAAKYGLSWGGDWKGRKDAMHFEYTGTQAPGAGTMSKEQLDVQKENTKEIVKQNEEKAKGRKATTDTIADLKFENEQQALKNSGKEREAAINAAIREAKAKDKEISETELQQIRDQAGALYDKQKALSLEEQKKKQLADLNNQVNELEEKRNGLLEQRKYYEEQGNSDKVMETTAALKGVNAELLAAIENAITYQEAIGGTKSDLAIQKLNNMKLAIANTNIEGKRFAMTATEMGQSIASSLESGIINMFDSFANAIANGENAVQALGKAFLQFAANFMMEIAKMILKQIMFNALQQIGKALGGGIFNFTSQHSGGLVGGAGNGTRAVAPGWFAGATRYHTGGVAGLKPDEVPTVLKEGEEVVTETDERHRDNIARAGSNAPNLKQVLVMNERELAGAMSSAHGEKVFMTFINRNAGTIRQKLNGG